MRSHVPAGTTSISSSTAPYYYDYSSSSIPLVQRGYLYNWPATMKSTTMAGTQGVCPTGWHVPTDAEWGAMESEVNGSVVSGTGYRGSHAGKLSTSCWWSESSTENAPGNYDNAERNSSGFSAVPAGHILGGEFQYAKNYAFFWSSSVSESYSVSRVLETARAAVRWRAYSRSTGLSIRCVRD